MLDLERSTPGKQTSLPATISSVPSSVCASAADGAGERLVALMLFRHRSGDANRRSAWICWCNDTVGNVAVLPAAPGVLGSGIAWPDLIVASITAALGIGGGWQIVRLAATKLRGIPAALAA